MMRFEFDDLFKYFDWTLMDSFLKQRAMECLNRGIEELKVKISKKDIEDKKAQLIAFVVNKTDLPLLIKPLRWFFKGYLEARADELITELLSLVKKTTRKLNKKSK